MKRAVLLLVSLATSTPASAPMAAREFAQRLAKFDVPYEGFKREFCGIALEATGRQSCEPGLTYSIAQYTKAREAAKRLFDLKEP